MQKLEGTSIGLKSSKKKIAGKKAITKDIINILFIIKYKDRFLVFYNQLTT